MAINSNRIIEAETPANQEKINSLLQNNELIQLLLNQLNITANLTTILTNEKLLFVLNESSKQFVTLEGQTYKKKARNYSTYVRIMELNEQNEKYKQNNPDEYTKIAESQLNMVYEVTKLLFGITDIKLVERNFEILQPIVHGEIYKMIDNVFSRWDYSKVTEQIAEMVKFSQRELKKELEKQNDLVAKAKQSNIEADEIKQKQDQYINDDGILIIQ